MTRTDYCYNFDFDNRKYKLFKKQLNKSKNKQHLLHLVQVPVLEIFTISVLNVKELHKKT